MVDPLDRDLVLRAREGEAQAFGELVRRYQEPAFNVCYRMLGERQEAEDLAQETFIRAYQRLGTFDENRPFGPWIRKVAANLCLNHLARSRPVQLPLDDERDRPIVAAGLGPEAALDRKQMREIVREAILELPPHYRAVIELRHYQDMSYAEIANTLDLPLSDVKSHLYRARRRLAERLRTDV